MAGGTALSVLLATASLLGVAAEPAAADSAATLPITSYSDMVVDGAHRRVFISGAGNKVVVADYNGKTIAQITSEPGAAGLVLSADSSTVYVALPTADAISAIDTATLRETARYPLGVAPRHLAMTKHTIWFGYTANGTGNLGSLDLDPPTTPPTDPPPTDPPTPTPTDTEPTPEPTPTDADTPTDPPVTDPPVTDPPPTDSPTTAAPTADTARTASFAAATTHTSTTTTNGAAVTLEEGAHSWNGAPLLASASGKSGTPDVVAAGSGGELAVFDVSADGAVLRASGSMDTSVEQIALTPDGKQVLTSWDTGGYGYGLGAYSTTDLSHVGRYPIDAYPNAVAVAPNGTVAGGSFSWYEPDVHIYKPGATTPTREYDFPNTGNSSGADTLVDGALAWAPDLSRIFAVSENSYGTYSLRALTDPTKEMPTLTVSAPATATRAKALTVSGKLTSKSAVPVGTVLTVTRTDLESPTGKALASVRTTSGGGFSFKDTPPAGGSVKYTVRYAGDTAHIAATASRTVAVSRATPALTLNNNRKLYDYGKTVVFTAHLGSTYKNRTVEIWADPYGGDKPNKLLKSARVNSGGNLSVSVSMTRNTTVTAVYKGDSRTAPRTLKSTGLARVKVSSTLSRYYRTGKIGSTSYYYFHKRTDVIDTTTMTYYKGRKQRLEVQVYYRGKWYNSASEYFKLGTNGKSAVNLGHPGQSGIRARVRSAYVSGSSGDTLNTTTYGAWKYICFTN
ncbi:hypothetical protein BGM09_04880 [Streptomyces sp. CBMA29]|nr:hypothetical protein [Streptomyces sp. CBMA29]